MATKANITCHEMTKWKSEWNSLKRKEQNIHTVNVLLSDGKVIVHRFIEEVELNGTEIIIPKRNNDEIIVKQEIWEQEAEPEFKFTLDTTKSMCIEVKNGVAIVMFVDK